MWTRDEMFRALNPDGVALPREKVLEKAGVYAPANVPIIVEPQDILGWAGVRESNTCERGIVVDYFSRGDATFALLVIINGRWDFAEID